MRKLLRLLLILGIVAFAVGITAFSCGKTADPPSNNNNNANNNSGGSGGGGDGDGGTPAPKPSPVNLVVTNLDVGAKIKGDTIYLNSLRFPDTRASWTREDFEIVSGAGGLTQRQKFFDVIITGGVIGADTPATGGIVLAAYGNIDKFVDATVVGNATGTPEQGIPPQNADYNITISSYHAGGGFSSWRGAPGVTIFSVFAANTTTPGYDFSRLNAGGANIKPMFYCMTTFTGFNQINVGGNAPPTTKLAGGQDAQCYGVSTYNTFPVEARGNPRNTYTSHGTAWDNTAASTTFRKTIEVTFIGIRTDEKTLATVGLPGATDAAKAAALNDGFSMAEMAALAAANPTGAKKYKISIVSKTVFDGL